jgi:anti-sigma B factor antagonist
MSGTTFQALVRSLPGVAILGLSGEIDSFAQEALHNAFQEAEELNPATILLNFTQASYINSTGIALIVGLLSKARQAQRSLIVCGLSEHYQEIFRITRLAEFIPVYPDEDSALRAAQRVS